MTAFVGRGSVVMGPIAVVPNAHRGSVAGCFRTELKKPF